MTNAEELQRLISGLSILTYLRTDLKKHSDYLTDY
jgi:hypothetical protein